MIALTKKSAYLSEKLSFFFLTFSRLLNDAEELWIDA
jgi:hypothetical protein